MQQHHHKKLNRLEQIAGISAIVALILGCLIVLRPFLSAITWAAILCFSTWPIFVRINRFCRGSHNWSATLTSLLITLVVITPLILISLSLTQDAKNAIYYIKDHFQKGIPNLPPWLESIPFLGDVVSSYWHDHGRLKQMFVGAAGQSSNWFVQRGLDVGQAVGQLLLSIFIAFFFYRDGPRVVQKVHNAIHRFAGDRTQKLLEIVGSTVRGVVYGILGTAVVQGILASIGFLIAGVPMPLILGFLTFILALLPMGPPLIWVPATVWLFIEDHSFRGSFMLIWGFFVISGVDNVLRPYLISRGSHLPFAVVLLGILGGILAFGFIGLFIGPTLLAVGFSLLNEWSINEEEDHRA